MKNRMAFTRERSLQDPGDPDAWRAWEAAKSSQFFNWFLFMQRRTSAVAPSGFVEDWIYFQDESGELDTRARATLGRRITLLRANPAMQVVICGVAAQPGVPPCGLRLGLRRVLSIRAFLRVHGVAPERIGVALRGWGWLVVEHAAESTDARSERSECRFQVTDAHWVLARN